MGKIAIDHKIMKKAPLSVLFSFCWVIIPFLGLGQVGDKKLPESVRHHVPGSGFEIYKGELGTLNFSSLTTMRYLNQLGLKDKYSDSFGREFNLDRRNDLQFQKVVLYFKGWALDPKFRYLIYIWSANTSQGLGAQVVLAGNLQYEFKKYLNFGVGMVGLPTTRAMLGNWPMWLRSDARPMAEEFFRGSYTSGIFLDGEIFDGLNYRTVLGNNLSQLGINAGQLDDGFDTWSTAFWWTTNKFGKTGSFGDFEYHHRPATMLGAAFTRSDETDQSQPGTEAPENSQIRLADGTGIFNHGAFNDTSRVVKAKYQMLSANTGVKFRGFSLDLEYYWRWVSDIQAIGDVGVEKLFDQGFSLRGSSMILKEKLQVYATYSYIDGQYGKPTELAVGLNWFILPSRFLRVNTELIFVDRSPVGSLMYPSLVGATGSIISLNLEMFL